MSALCARHNAGGSRVCIPRLLSGITTAAHSEKAAMDTALQECLAEIKRLQTANDELTRTLMTSHGERVKAETAYTLIATQQSPFRLQYHKVSDEVSQVRSAHATALQLNGDMCLRIIDTLLTELRKHFGYIPRPIENKVEEVHLDVKFVDSAISSGVALQHYLFLCTL
jgi:hypothetical protein